MAWVNRWPFMQNKSHQVTFKVFKADKPCYTECFLYSWLVYLSSADEIYLLWLKVAE